MKKDTNQATVKKLILKVTYFIIFVIVVGSAIINVIGQYGILRSAVRQNLELA
jgi:hypothetical protein